MSVFTGINKFIKTELAFLSDIKATLLFEQNFGEWSIICELILYTNSLRVVYTI